VTVGTSRIFTFEGGNEVIWSSTGNIAAGSASKTLVSAPPARFLIDPVSGASTFDPSGLATGGGIGVLQTVKDAPPGNVDLIAPVGFVDAGDAGIRSSGDVNIAAVLVLNAFNIQAQGSTTGVPQVVAPNVLGLAAASNATAATQQAAAPTHTGSTDRPSVIIVEVLGFGGAAGSESGRGDDQPRDDEGRRSFNDRGADPEYNSRSAVQITGYGMLSETEAQMLTPEERRKLNRY
jgi:Filamentous haemagglutinin family outer membrane protein